MYFTEMIIHKWKTIHILKEHHYNKKTLNNNGCTEQKRENTTWAWR